MFQLQLRHIQILYLARLICLKDIACDISLQTKSTFPRNYVLETLKDSLSCAGTCG